MFKSSTRKSVIWSPDQVIYVSHDRIYKRSRKPKWQSTMNRDSCNIGDKTHIYDIHCDLADRYILTKYNIYTGIMSRERLHGLGFKLLRAYMLNVFCKKTSFVLNSISTFIELSLSRYLSWRIISPRGYHLPSSQSVFRHWQR